MFHRNSINHLLLLSVALLLAPQLCGADRESTQPVRLELAPLALQLQRGQSHRLLLTAFYKDGSSADWTAAASYQTSHAELITVNAAGIVQAQAAGTATVTAQANELEATVDISILETAFPVVPDFDTHIVAALSRAGCSQGACHGSPQGKGGFLLSLRGFQPPLDFKSLAREEMGRRLNPLDPENSLILLKGTSRIAHQGGKRFTHKDEDYQVLHRWIGAGHPASSHVRTLEQLELIPSVAELHRSAPQQQLLARAHFSDGSVEDVTGLAVFEMADNAAATVSDDGQVSFSNTAEAAVLVRFLDRIETVRLTYINRDEDFKFASPRVHNPIDELVFARQAQLQLKPAGLATDEIFLRRVYLDAIGAIPTPAEARAFLDSDDPDKRTRLISELLEREEYARFWALKWADVMRANREAVSLRGVHSFHRFLIRIFADDQPLDQVAARILTSRGNTIHYPEANFYRIARTPTDAAESFSQLFLGVRIQCAKCHNHPYESISQRNYYELSAHFSRVRLKGIRFGLDDEVVFLAQDGDVTMPGTEEPLTPAAFGVVTATDSQSPDRRSGLANWLTTDENQFFARSTVNRIWYHLMGQGIVEPIDDFRRSNPPSNPELLDLLASRFIEEGYRVRPVVEMILNSSTYQLSSRDTVVQGERAADASRYFVAPIVRLLTAEQILDAISTATGIPEVFEGYPLGTTAVGLAEGNVNHKFLKAFTRPIRDVACDCARDTDPTLNQVIHLLNNPSILDKIDAPDSRLGQWLTQGLADSEVIENVYLATLSRRPTRQEYRIAHKHFKAVGDRAAAMRDLQHALLNANEFLLRH